MRSTSLLSQGSNTGEACKQLGVSEQTYYRWRKLYGGIKVDQAKRLNRPGFTGGSLV